MYIDLWLVFVAKFIMFTCLCKLKHIHFGTDVGSKETSGGKQLSQPFTSKKVCVNKTCIPIRKQNGINMARYRKVLTKRVCRAGARAVAPGEGKERGGG